MPLLYVAAVTGTEIQSLSPAPVRLLWNKALRAELFSLYDQSWLIRAIPLFFALISASSRAKDIQSEGAETHYCERCAQPSWHSSTVSKSAMTPVGNVHAVYLETYDEIHIPRNSSNHTHWLWIVFFWLLSTSCYPGGHCFWLSLAHCNSILLSLQQQQQIIRRAKTIDQSRCQPGGSRVNSCEKHKSCLQCDCIF